MKDQTLDNAQNLHCRPALHPTPLHRSCALAFPSSSARLKKRLQHSNPPPKPSAKVFLPLSPEDRKHLEALFPTLAEVERRLDADISPGHPRDQQTRATVQLQSSCQASSLWQRRRPAPVLV